MNLMEQFFIFPLILVSSLEANISMIFDCKKAFYIETFFCYTTSQYLLHRNETVLMLGSTVQLCLLCNIHTSRNFIIVVSFSYSQPIKLQPQFIAWYCNLVQLLETWYHIHDQEIQPNLTSKIFSQKTQQTINIRFKKKINTPATLQKKSSLQPSPVFLGLRPSSKKEDPELIPYLYQAAGVLTCLFYCLFWVVGCQSPSGVPEKLPRPGPPNGGLAREMEPVLSKKSGLVKYYNLARMISKNGKICIYDQVHGHQKYQFLKSASANFVHPANSIIFHWRSVNCCYDLARDVAIFRRHCIFSIDCTESNNVLRHLMQFFSEKWLIFGIHIGSNHHFFYRLLFLKGWAQMKRKQHMLMIPYHPWDWFTY